MNNLEYKQLKGIVGGEKFYFFKATENFLYKDGKRRRSESKTIYGNKDPARYYTVKSLERRKM